MNELIEAYKIAAREWGVWNHYRTGLTLGFTRTEALIATANRYLVVNDD